jgi:dienelactone hydrolase
VVTPVVDFALTLRGVDPDRIALLGMSMGGYLAPRAAAFEPRIAACIAFDGVFNLAAALAASMQGAIPGLAHDPAQSVVAVDHLIAHRTELPTGQRWLISNALWAFGVDTAQELLGEIVKYDLSQIAKRIACPTLVCDAENDQFLAGQPVVLYEALTCPKTFLAFTAAEGAGEHCQEGALTLFHQRMFDWLDDTLRG